MTLGVLAASSSSDSNVQAGVLGFLVVAGIGVALVFLLRSMNKQFRKITPEPGPGSPGSPDDAAPDAAAGAAAPGSGAADGDAASGGEEAGREAKTPAQTPE